MERYGRRISGPLRDRIDLWIAMPRVEPSILMAGPDPEPSANVAPRIAVARRHALLRNGGRLNARLRGRQLRAVCRLDDPARRRAEALARSEGASARGTERLLRLARTIADLGGANAVTAAHLDEAAWFRSSAARSATALAS